ncbi:MAG TPA: BON domain-containing protein [Blastocatellia bacterium]|nr:BON domain-containing protein [Blastocatellia bacterium]
MRKLTAVVALLLIVGGVGFYVYKNGWKRPESLSSLFSSSGDMATTRKVKTALGLSRRVGGFEIDASTSDGVVTLTGQAPSEDVKSFAAEIARDTPGVKDVKNEIAVNPTAQPSVEGSRVEDLEIKTSILEALTRSTELGGKQIEVKVENRIVTLAGSVETPAQRNGVEQTARAVSGVAGVTNNLAVTNPQAVSEPPVVVQPESGLDLAKKVEFELFRSEAFDTTAMSIKADGGAVTLSGNVRSRAELLLAERFAQGVPGVKKVINELRAPQAARR